MSCDFSEDKVYHSTSPENFAMTDPLDMAILLVVGCLGAMILFVLCGNLSSSAGDRPSK